MKSALALLALRKESSKVTIYRYDNIAISEVVETQSYRDFTIELHYVLGTVHAQAATYFISEFGNSWSSSNGTAKDSHSAFHLARYEIDRILSHRNLQNL